jgi:hypothetical protein
LAWSIFCSVLFMRLLCLWPIGYAPVPSVQWMDSWNSHASPYSAHLLYVSSVSECDNQLPNSHSSMRGTYISSRSSCHKVLLTKLVYMVTYLLFHHSAWVDYLSNCQVRKFPWTCKPLHPKSDQWTILMACDEINSTRIASPTQDCELLSHVCPWSVDSHINECSPEFIAVNVLL